MVRERYDEVDRISSLSDYLLGHLLSFVPTKDAVATSVLSRRWRYAFTRITRFNFDDSPICHCLEHERQTAESFSTFKLFVDKVLHACKSEKITYFDLKFGTRKPRQSNCSEGCYPELEPMRLSSWVSFPLTHGVRKLDLCVYQRKPTNLPLALFDCQTLEVLKLDLNHDHDQLQVPMSCHLPNLKVFHLAFLNFPLKDSLNRLISSCPRLEDLALTGECWNADIPVTISSYSLRRLVIHVYTADSEDGQRKEFVLDTPILEFLDFSDYFALHYSIGDMDSLVEARVDTFYSLGPNGPDPILSLAESFSNVQRLFLSSGCLKAMQECGILKGKLPVFRNLKHLSLENICHEVLFDLIYYSCVLQTLTFSQEIEQDVSYLREKTKLESEYWSTLKTIPFCLESHLKKITIENFQGIDCDLSMYKYFLRNAYKLAELVIVCEDSMTKADRISLESSLKKLPRRLTTCSIKVQ